MSGVRYGVHVVWGGVGVEVELPFLSTGEVEARFLFQQNQAEINVDKSNHSNNV